MNRIIILLTLFIISCASTSKIEESVPVAEATKPSAEDSKVTPPVGSEEPKFDEVGLSSWYGEQFQNKQTASGEMFDRFKLTAAHRTLPFGTAVRVHNLDNKKETLVRINDRGPYNKTRILDVSERAAEILEFKEVGVARVGLTIVKEDISATPSSAEASEKPQPKTARDDDTFSLEDEEEDEEEDDEDLLSPPKKEANKKPTTNQPPPTEVKPAPTKTVAPTKKEEAEPEEKVTKTDGQPKGFTVQIGVFKEKKRAESFRNQVKASFSERVYLFNRSGTFVVQIGDFKSRGEATLLRDKLKTKGIFGFIPPK
jgi:rare lipoprotein A